VNENQFNQMTDPGYLGNEVYRLRQELEELKRSFLDVNNVSEIAEAGEGLINASTQARIDGALMVQRLGIIYHGGGLTPLDFTLPPNAFLEDNIVEYQLTGVIWNNSGGSMSFAPQIFHTSATLTSQQAISVPTGTSPRNFTYRVRMQQAPNLGSFVQSDEELRIESPTGTGTAILMLRSTIVELNADLSDELALQLQASITGVTDYVNFRITLNIQTVRLIDGISASQQYFWTQPTAGRGYDTSIQSALATTNFGTNVDLAAGESNAGANIRRTLIRFDDIANLPKDAIIDGAFLWLRINQDLSSTGRTFELYRVVRNWVVNQATWNEYATGQAWGTAGCGNNTTDYDGSVVLGSAILSAAETPGKLAIFSFTPAEFQKFVDGTYTNYGWLIKAQTETNDGYNFDSADVATLAWAPLLEVRWHYPDPT
jgi:disaggregatase-related protein